MRKGKRTNFFPCCCQNNTRIRQPRFGIAARLLRATAAWRLVLFALAVLLPLYTSVLALQVRHHFGESFCDLSFEFH